MRTQIFRALGRRLAALLAVCSFAGGVSALAATLTVNTTSDEDSRNGSLSLREALLLAAGNMSRPLSTSEKNQVIDGAQFFEAPPFSGLWFVFVIDPGVGREYPDTIQFDSGVTMISPTSELPKLGHNDSINGALGDSQRLILDGNGAGDAYGILSSDSNFNTTHGRIENLIVRKFQRDGIAVDAAQGGRSTGWNSTRTAAGWCWAASPTRPSARATTKSAAAGAITFTATAATGW